MAKGYNFRIIIASLKSNTCKVERISVNKIKKTASIFTDAVYGFWGFIALSLHQFLG